MRLKILSICSVLMLMACSTTSPMKVALTELGTSSRSEKIAGGYEAQLVINITGLAPHDEIGTVSYDPDRFSLLEFLNIFSPNPKDIPDVLSPKLSPSSSIVYERTFCDGQQNNCASETDIINIKQAINLQDTKIEALSNAEIELATIKIIQTAISKNPANTEKYLTVLKQQFPSNESIQSGTKDNHGAKLADASKALADEIKIITANLDEIKSSVNKPGIIITNWKLDRNFSAETAVAGAGGSYSNKKDLQGYLILGNPSVSTLYIGDDAKTIKDGYKDVSGLFRNKSLYMTFYQVRARQVLYAESLQSTISAQAGLRLNQLISTLSAAFAGGVNLKGLENLELTIDARYARFSLSSNQGFLDATKGNSRMRKLLGNSNDQCNSKAESCEDLNQKSVPVISSKINLDKYLE